MGGSTPPENGVHALKKRLKNQKNCTKKGKPQKELPKHHLKPRSFTLINKITRRHGRRRGTSQHDTMSCGWCTKSQIAQNTPKNGVWGHCHQPPGGSGGVGGSTPPENGVFALKKKVKKTAQKKANHKKNYLSTI